jgi:hypothetical protein
MPTLKLSLERSSGFWQYFSSAVLAIFAALEPDRIQRKESRMGMTPLSKQLYLERARESLPLKISMN